MLAYQFSTFLKNWGIFFFFYNVVFISAVNQLCVYIYPLPLGPQSHSPIHPISVTMVSSLLFMNVFVSSCFFWRERESVCVCVCVCVCVIEIFEQPYSSLVTKRQ